KMPTLEERPAEVTTANAMEVTTSKTVISLTVELPPEHAAELAGLMAGYVSFADFPWAEAIYEALCPVGTYHAALFADVNHGMDVFLERKKDGANAATRRLAVTSLLSRRKAGMYMHEHRNRINR